MAASPQVLAEFASDGSLRPESYERLFVYFLDGFLQRRSSRGAYARYPGWPSFNGRQCDDLEGVSRFLPLAAAWLHGNRASEVALDDGRTCNLVELIQTALAHGTDPASPEYWGAIGHRDQRIVEAADVALAIWLSRDSVWRTLNPATHRRVVEWLSGVNARRTADNNWHLFIVLVDAVLGALGEARDEAVARERYDRFKTFYRGDGWFSDGPDDKFDYYAAWGIQYPLHWLQRMNPAWDREFLVDCAAQFASGFRYFFGPHGFPIMGRSVCYRMAAPAPLVQAATSTGGVTLAEARRALDVTWRHFVRHGAVESGLCTQGYGRADPRILDNYSGPASPLWSLRSLVAAMALPPDSAFWTAEPGRLPVEREDFELALRPPGWTLRGDHSSGDVVLHTNRQGGSDSIELQSYSAWRRAVDRLRHRAGRPDNTAAKYGRATYSSRTPFCGYGPVE